MGNKTERKNWYRDPLTMPIGEIVQEYRTAKNPNKMIDILADMNDTNPVRIAWILNRCGMTVDPKKMPRAPRSEWEEEPREYWARSNDAVECDRIRQRFEALEAEREQKARETAQSMPGFDEPEEAGCKEEREEKNMTVKEAFEPESRIIERIEAAFEADEQKPVPADCRRGILTDAAACVCTDRNMLYGEAEDNFAVIAKMWSAYLGVSVNVGNVADMMILFKVARNATAKRASRDTYVDIAGYAACGGAIAADEQEGENG